MIPAVGNLVSGIFEVGYGIGMDSTTRISFGGIIITLALMNVLFRKGGLRQGPLGKG